MRRTPTLALLAALAIGNAPALRCEEAAPAPALRVDPTAVTVSGISAGGQMAHQLHFAYSDLFSGAAILAGGPYGCANGELATALTRCMGQVADPPLPVDELEASIRSAATEGRIADPAHLADDRVWLYRGRLDSLVAEEVSDALQRLYLRFVPPGNVRYEKELEAAHLFPTLATGSPCDQSQAPYLGACDFDAAGKLLAQLYGPLSAPTTEGIPALRTLTVEGADAAGLMDQAWLFVPGGCESEEASCRLHVVLHGCLQSVATAGQAFIEQTGYLRWAASNRIVLLFPQVEASPVNPYGCWDWWGYTGGEYRFREGPQMKAVVGLVRELTGE